MSFSSALRVMFLTLLPTNAVYAGHYSIVQIK